MEAVLSSKGQIVLPVAARRKLKLFPGERLEVELRDDGVFLRPSRRPADYDLKTHPVSGLPRMISRSKTARKVTAEDIARLNAELL